MQKVDIVVLGAGSAGICAAIQAARAGASCLLVEKNGMAGGTTTVSAVNFPGLFHAWGNQVIAGIGWDLINKTVEFMNQALPDFSKDFDRHPKHHILINIPIYASLCDEALISAGVEVLFHTMITEVQSRDNHWQLSLCTKEGLQKIQAKVLIDCSADASLAHLAGAELMVPTETQPATLMYRVAGYKYDELDIEVLNQALQLEVASGRLRGTDFSWHPNSIDISNWLKDRGIAKNHIIAEQADTSRGRSLLEMEARRRLRVLVQFLRRQPGLENLYVDWMSSECGVRETSCIRGEVVITEDDYISGKLWPDAVCNSFYPIDLHRVSGDTGIDMRYLREGVVPSVPLRALKPKGIDNLLVAGRCLSSTRLAHSALRVQATAMATGQAVGALAALAALNNCNTSEVKIQDCHELLKQYGAIVPELGQ